MRKIKFVSIFIFISIFVLACGGVSESRKSENLSVSDSDMKTTDIPKNQRAPLESAQVAKESEDSGSGNENATVPNREGTVSLNDAKKSADEEPSKFVERKIIRNANLKLETESPEEVQRKISSIADGKKGFVITSTQKNSGVKSKGRNWVSMKIRIPADKFQESLDEIRKTADRVVSETVSGQDVTEEFVDIEARLKTKKALETRFLEIMKSAKNVSEALNVERQLAGVRTEIERIEGRKRFLQSQTSLSTITIELRTPAAFSASSSGFFYELRQAFSDGFEAALTFILYLVRILIAILPFLLLIVLPVFLLLRYFWRKYKKQRTARKIVEEEIRDKNIIHDE